MNRQPRVKGVRRQAKHSALLPVVRQGLERLARSENRSVSWVIAELVSDLFDLDAQTGQPLPRRRRA